MMQNARYIAAGLSDSDMLWLLSMGKLRRLAAGETLVTAGKPVRSMDIDALDMAAGNRIS